MRTQSLVGSAGGVEGEERRLQEAYPTGGSTNKRVISTMHFGLHWTIDHRQSYKQKHRQFEKVHLSQQNTSVVEVLEQ